MSNTVEPVGESRELSQTALATPGRRARWALYFHQNGYNLALVTVVAWIANYLHFTSFGLYEDDWFFVGFPFVVDVKTWMEQSLWQQLTVASQGRPVQITFDYLFAEIGAMANSLQVDYLLAFALFAASAILMYEVIRRRFSRLAATLAALLFVLTPLHTLHQFLNGQFSSAPAFILVFLAMLLYLRGSRGWSYVFAFLTVLSYESIFFLFLGTPLLKRGKAFRDRGREWLIHLGAFVAIVVFAFAMRKTSGEARVEALPHGLALLWPVVHWWLFYSYASFATYLYAALRVHEASLEAWLYLVVFWALIGLLFYRQWWHTPVGTRTLRATLTGLLRSAGIGLLFLVLGYAVSYFFFLQPVPHLSVTDRETRISIAASFGSSLLLAILLAGWIRSCRVRATRLIAYACTAAFLAVLFLYSFVVQDDYVKDWEQQREDARQLIALTPDAQRDSVIILKLAVGGDGFFMQGPRRRGNGLEKTLYEQMFPSVFARGQAWPQLFIVYSDAWPNYLKQAADGFMDWTQTSFNGRWYRASGRYRPGRFIVLEETEPGWVVRKSQPIFVNGIQIVQIPPREAPRSSLWETVPPNRLGRQFLPESARQSVVHPGIVGLQSKPYLTASMKVYFPANAKKVEGPLEPLVVTGASGIGDIVSVRYLGDNRLIFRIDHWGFLGVESNETVIDPTKLYSVDVGQADSGTMLSLNGNQILAHSLKPYLTTRKQITFGLNRIGGGITGPKFSGKVLSTEIGPAPDLIATVKVKFPPNAVKTTGLLDPLIVTGAAGAGDLVSVRYLGHNRMVFRIDHWGYPGVESEETAIDPAKVYSVEVGEGAGGTTLSLNGNEVLTQSLRPYVTTREQIAFGTNAIGGSFTGQKFSGKVLSTNVIRTSPKN